MLKYKCGAAGAARAVRARSGSAPPAVRHAATSLHAAALHPTRTRPSPRPPLHMCGDANVDVAKVAGKVAKAAAKVVKVAKVVKIVEELQVVLQQTRNSPLDSAIR